MRQDRLETGVIIYSAAISACEKAKQSEEALELLGQMWQEGPEPKFYHVPRSHQRCVNAKQSGRHSAP